MKNIKWEQTKYKGIYKRGNKYIIDITKEGVRIYEVLPTECALEFVKKVQEKKIQDIFEMIYFPRKIPESITIKTVLDVYWKDKIDPKIKYWEPINNRKSECLKNNIHFVNDIIKNIGDIPLRMLSVKNILEYQSLKTGIGKKPRTINRTIQILNFSINHCIKKGMFTVNPIKGWEAIEEAEPNKILFDNGEEAGPQWKTFYDNLPEDKKDIFLMLYETGMYPGEVYQSKWGWVDMENKYIRIPEFITKNLKERHVPISEKLKEMLTNRKKTGEYIFPNKNTGLPMKGTAKAFSGAIKRSGLIGKGLKIMSIRKTRLNIWNKKSIEITHIVSGHTQNSESYYKYNVDINRNRIKELI